MLILLKKIDIMNNIEKIRSESVSQYNILKEYLNEILLKEYNYKTIDGCDLEHTILNTLSGSLRTTRLGAAPTIETNNEIIKRIQYKIKRNEPIELTSAWGAMKTIPSSVRGVDLAELLAIRQFNAISNAINKIYKPGVRFNIYIADSFYIYLYGYDARLKEYFTGMKKLISDYPEIKIIRLSDLCSELNDVEKQCKLNFEYLYNYWYESEKIEIENHYKLKSYRELSSLGWVGTITQPMRDFYIKRMQKLYPKESNDFWIKKSYIFLLIRFLLAKMI